MEQPSIINEIKGKNAYIVLGGASWKHIRNLIIIFSLGFWKTVRVETIYIRNQSPTQFKIY